MELRPLRSDDSRLGPPPFGRIVKFPLDLATPLDANTLHGLDGALAAHGLLVIEGQYDLGPVMEWSFISSFPWLDPENSASLTSADAAWWQFADCPMVRRLGDAVDEAGNLVGLLNRIGYEWHTDGSGATLLYCENAPESPPRTTLFASGAAAYGALPQDKRMEAEAVLVCYSTRFVTGDTATIDYEAGVRMTPNGLRPALGRACQARCVSRPPRQSGARSTPGARAPADRKKGALGVAEEHGPSANRETGAFGRAVTGQARGVDAIRHRYRGKRAGVRAPLEAGRRGAD